MFPTSHLISHEQLKSLKISIQPGFIYFGVSIEFNEDSRGIDDGSIYLNEPSYYNAIAIPTREIQRKLVIKRFSRTINTDQEIENEEPAFESSWRGRVADIEQLTNSREVYHGKQRVSTLAQGKIVRDYILETPLELPPGYVMDTLFKLQKRRAEIPRLAKKVSQVIFDSSNIKSDSHALTTITFPQGEPELRGIEGSWRFGEDAWLMQSILMARLIGGAFWR